MSKKNPPLPAIRIEMGKPERFRQAVKVLEGLVTEVRLRIGKTKMTMTEMDAANVCMARLIVDKSFCVSYEAAESCIVNLNLHDLHGLLRRMQDNDTLVLTNHEDKLRVTFDDSKSERTYTLPYLDISEREQKLPELKMEAKTRMPSKAFQRTILDADIIGETIAFTSDEHGFTVSTKNDAEFGYASTYKGATKSDGAQRSKYSVEYLKKIVDAHTVGGEAIIEHSKDYPLCVTFGDEHLELTFVLAPRVDSE